MTAIYYIWRRNHSLWRRTLPIAVLLLTLLAIAAPLRVSAHASLVTAVPEPNTRLAEPPPSITLTFNERLDAGLFYIKVYNEDGDSVTNAAAVMTADQTGVSLPLPKLPEGAYLVSYHVISADGHPVSGSYPLAIGPGSPEAAITVPSNPASGGHAHGFSDGFGVEKAGKFLSRGIYFAALLAAAGWAFWIHLASSGTPTAVQAAAGESRQSWRTWTTNTLRVHVIALLFLIATHAPDYVGEGGWDEVVQLFTSTSIGLNWVASFALGLIGLVVVGRSRYLDIAWAAALLLVKSLSGHANAASAQPWPIVADYVHLLGAAVWVGGMWAVLASLNIDRSTTMGLLRRFSPAALMSIVLLTVTGIISTVLYVPKLSYLLYAEWGYTLIAKIVLVAAVVIVAAFLRFRIRSTDDPMRVKRLLTAEVSLIAAILLAVGVLTYLPPKPQNEPFYWHKMGPPLHVTATITPNVPGADNTVTAVVWLPKEAGDPKQVRVQLSSLDNKEIAPISIPVVQVEKTGNDASYGDLQRYTYRAQGPYVPFGGSWKLTVTVRNSNDDELQEEQTFRVF
ncbi:copper resistance CopC/CopD family protein [Paenibacillus chartarius]|uniref:Copper resistance CopC/CopD family protein n=1 Tax=Paenibacillus chartarius TaxID=747481 RepID=A0ABV6DMQ6_9BACL